MLFAARRRNFEGRLSSPEKAARARAPLEASAVAEGLMVSGRIVRGDGSEQAANLFGRNVLDHLYPAGF